MTTIFYIWAIVATSSGNMPKKEWTYMGEYANIQACYRAAETLEIKIFRCISKETGK